MEFRTALVLEPSSWRIGHTDKVLSMGSCFSDMVGLRLQDRKFNPLVNPFGTLFNPSTIFQLLDNPTFKREHLVERENAWFSMDVHSSFFEDNPEAVLDQLETVSEQVQTYLKQTQFIILTFGTAFVHVYNPTGAMIANCQKVPQKYFSKKLLSSNFILKKFKELDEKLRQFNPDLRYILSVSPVRHLKEGIELNHVSKSTLRVACHKITKEFSHVQYFPALEIMCDDLRDYRFYKEDMIHPSAIAEDYIWEKFQTMFFTEATIEKNLRIERLQRSLNHRPFNPQSEHYTNFLKDLQLEIEDLESLGLDFEKQKNQLDGLFSLNQH